jgi:hypothetical protein
MDLKEHGHRIIPMSWSIVLLMPERGNQGYGSSICGVTITRTSTLSFVVSLTPADRCERFIGGEAAASLVRSDSLEERG